MIRDLILRNRSYRRFDQAQRISTAQLRNWVELARFSASGRNAQPLKYILISGESQCAGVFPLTTWAGYLKDWGGPAEGERPVAYIIQLHDTTIAPNYFCDDGIAAQSILLGAVEEGFGGCIIASVNKPKLRELLQIGSQFEIIQLIALGKPVEKVVLEELTSGDTKYWRDGHGVHHVPKRPLDELIISE